MVTLASSTPIGAIAHDSGLAPRPASRNLVHNAPVRPPLKRQSSSAMLVSRDAQRHAPDRPFTIDASVDSDDDDDDGPAPALSAAAEMLLRTQDRADNSSRGSSGGGGNAWEYHSGSPKSRANPAVSRLQMRDGLQSATVSPSPRVVRLNRNSPVVSGLRRSASDEEVGDGSPLVRKRDMDLKTPATRPRSALASSVNYSSGRYRSGVSGVSSGTIASGSKPSSVESRPAQGQDPDALSRQPSTRQQHEERGLHNSIRIKRTERVGGLSGNFLKGPARRGIIRRQSDDQSPIDGQGENALEKPASQYDDLRREEGSPIYRDASPAPSNHVRFAGSADYQSTRGDAEILRGPSPERVEEHQFVVEALEKSELPEQNLPSTASTALQDKESSKARPITFKVPPPLPSQLDQENEPPPTFKRNKPDTAVLGVKKMSAQSVEKARRLGSPGRKALAPRSQNTPLRPAPPPPKLTVLETATATAGAASVAQTKKKRTYVTVNNKLFTRMECIGRGGSGRVYRVMAENFKLFALKKVSLEDVDENAIRGFKGEIDLLRKLENVDRVVRLYDYEINDEKKSLSVLMDIGELDLKKILDPYLDEDTGRLDLTFARQTWKEMLECVKAIHAFDVVHSDLKPANFVMMQGRLKLIDFGIANAIQDDTVNVHREHQIGTPNYMAPEALLDTNALGGKPSNLGKLMKLGKSSDVWSLGCILYQIAYGKPPFGHIPNSMSKILAITDRNYIIAFPEFGVGHVPVPPGLLRTLKRCLSRDPAQRPSIESLLNYQDPFLYPDSPGYVPVTQEIVRRLQENVLKIIEAKGMPTAANDKLKEVAVKEWLDEWSPQLFGSMKLSMEKGTA